MKLYFNLRGKKITIILSQLKLITEIDKLQEYNYKHVLSDLISYLLNALIKMIISFFLISTQIHEIRHVSSRWHLYDLMICIILTQLLNILYYLMVSEPQHFSMNMMNSFSENYYEYIWNYWNFLNYYMQYI